MQILRAGLATVAITSGSLVVPDVARAQFGPPGSGCTFTTLQAAINNAIATNQPDIYAAMPGNGVLTWSEDVMVPVPSGQQVRIVPADSTCSMPAASVRPLVWLGAGAGSAVTVTDEGTLTIENTHLMGVDGRGILVVADEAVVHLVDTWVSDGVADYGGGIAIDACASVTVDDGSRIVGNTALIDGGGIWDGPASCAFETIEIRGRIDDNEAAVNGGGLYVDGSRAVLVGEAAIEKNRAVAGSGGGVYATLGATLELEGTMWTPVPELGIPTGGLRVTDNVADQSGGGVALVGAALSGGPVVIASNVAGEGGGIHVDGVPGAVPFPGTADLVNAVLQNNLAQGNGGAMAAVTPAGLGAFPSRLTLVGDVDACGWAAGFPPNRYCAELRANEALSGGGVYLRDADAVLEQVAASYNTGSNISAIQLVAGSNMDMDNCLLETDGGSVDTIRVENPGTFDAINSTFAGSGLRVVYLAGTVGNLDCNVFGDPGAGGPSLFVDPTAAVNGVDNAGFGVGSIAAPAGGSNLNNPAPLFAAAAPHRHRLDPLSPAVGICKNVLPFDLVGVTRLDDPGAFELP